MRHFALLLLAVCVPSSVSLAAESQVLLLGTFHFDNPGLDMHNVEAVDVMAPGPQREIAAIVDALARFEPDRVFVEWPAAATDERYARYRDDRLDPTPNEVVQLGFRLARQRDLPRVHGIDVPGDFPFGPIGEWAERNGQSMRLKAMNDSVAAKVAHIGALQREHGIAAALRHMNDPAVLRRDQAMYLDLLRYGSGDEQPGAALNAAWFTRNIHICARLLQQLEPGERAVVIFGAGHVPWLQRCLADTPGVELADTLDYLPARRAERASGR
jgi:hypothetical protein